MSLNPQRSPEVPEETAIVARAAFPKGNTYIRMRDELGPVFADEQFVGLYPDRGQPAESPARLALVTIMQFAEGLSDRQAADAVRARIDWKYALGLEITDPGFDASVLSEFRTRLIEGSAELLLFETMLTCLRDKGLLKVRGRMRTDSTHILAAIRSLSRLECIGETLRQALNVLATIVPDWLSEWAPADWYDRYGRRFEDYRLPKSREDRYTLGEQIGRDGMQLWQQLGNHPELTQLRNLPVIETLRQVWLQQFMIEDKQLKWRPADELPPASLLINSPYDIEARFSKKRKTEWTGYKVHLSESCDEELPHLIVNVETTAATTTDYEMTAEIHDHLAERDLLPGEHLLDKGYMSADNLVDSQEQQIDLVGPVAEDPSWQAHAGEGFESAAFVIDWEKKQATCPQGHPSHKWFLLEQKNTTVYNFRFHKKHCDNCLARVKCTKSATSARSLTIQPQTGYEALRTARQRQKEEVFWQQYAKRAGVEGTISQGIAIADLRRARYIGLAKTHLQHMLTALGMNILRLGAWWSEIPKAQTRISPFARLEPAIVVS
jgi:transposase